jgi:hypothetical protein
VPARGTGCVGGAGAPSARYSALASLLLYGVRDHEIKSMEAPSEGTKHWFCPVTGQAVSPVEGVKRELGPPGCRLGVAEGGLARAARSKGAAGSQFGRNHHGGAPLVVHRGAGGTWGAKKIPPNWPWVMDVR